MGVAFLAPGSSALAGRAADAPGTTLPATTALATTVTATATTANATAVSPAMTDGAASASDERPAPPLARVAVRYVRLEAWLDRYRERGTYPIAMAEIGNVSTLFFTGRLEAVGERLDATILATAGVVGADRARLDAALALDLTMDGGTVVRAGAPADATVSLRVGGGDAAGGESFELSAATASVAVPPRRAAANDLPRTRRIVALVGPDDDPGAVTLEIGRTGGLDPEQTRDVVRRLRTELQAVADGPVRARIAARVALLERWAGEAFVHRFAIDGGALAHELQADIAAATAGADPATTFVGDRWIPMRLAGAEVPTRLVVPAPARERTGDGDAASDRPPPPLLIALHGAGGSEHLFVDGYAGGRLVRAAETSGFVLVSPRTTALFAPGAFDDLLAAVAEHVDFDRTRIRIVGHSLGGMLGGTLAGRHPNRIERAALIAGAPGGLPDSIARPADLPPLLVIAGGRDRVIPTRGLRSTWAGLDRVGAAPVWWELPEADHLLVVGASLDGALEWLETGSLPADP